MSWDIAFVPPNPEVSKSLLWEPLKLTVLLYYLILLIIVNFHLKTVRVTESKVTQAKFCT